MADQDVQHAHAELTVLVLLAPHPRRCVHQRREGAISARQRPYALELFRVECRALADHADGGTDIARFLNRRLDARAQRIGQRVVMAPQRAMLDIDGFRQVRRQGDETVVRHIVHPLDDLGDGATSTQLLAGFPEQADRNLFRRAGNAVGDGKVLRFDRQVGYLQAFVQERVAAFREIHLLVVLDAIAQMHQPLRDPVAQATLFHHRHDDVDVGLELDQPFLLRFGDAVANAGEFHAVAFLERRSQRDEILGIHFVAVGMALVADDLVDRAGQLAVLRRRPIPLGGFGYGDYRAPVGGVTAFHRLHQVGQLAVVAAVITSEDIPAIGCPLRFQIVLIGIGRRDHAAQ